jgi:acetylornithine deacetylase
LGDNPQDFAIVGEPTGMQLAIAERGLLVLDCVARGRAGHAARDEGDNAIYHAVRDIEWFRTYRFPHKSPLFGEVKMSVTIISAGSTHNVVPAECRFTVDCRVTEQYTNEEVLAIVREHVESEVTPRSLHLRSSSIDPSHPVVQAGVELGLGTYGSPTTSDQVALTAIPSVKVGPGESARSHTADEYVLLSEIEHGIDVYIKLLDKLL